MPAPAPVVTVTWPLPEPAGELLAPFDTRVEARGRLLTADELREAAATSDALVCLLRDRIDAAVLEAGEGRLKVVGNYAVGVDNIDLEAAGRLGIRVVNTPGILTECTADLAFALLLGVTRRVVEADQLCRSGGFPGWEPSLLLGSGLQGKTLGILGMGRIGQAVARRARPFGLEVVYHNRNRLLDSIEAELGARWVTLDELLETSDFLSLHAPLTPKTRHVLDEPALRRMKPDAVVVNTARGPLIDEAALVRVLESGHLGGAGLDVFEDEPALAPGLARLENVLLLPHVGSATREVRSGMARLVASGVAAVLRGEDPPNLVETRFQME